MSAPKLRPEVKRQWLAALRSGEYEQGREYLHFVEGGGEFYCCLGVLCDLAVKDGVVAAKTLHPSPDPDTDDAATRSGYEALVDYADVGEATTLPPAAVDDWAYEVPPPASDDPWTVLVTDQYEPDYTRQLTLAELNDEHGYSFAQIADLIEGQL